MLLLFINISFDDGDDSDDDDVDEEGGISEKASPTGTFERTMSQERYTNQCCMSRLLTI